MTFEKWNTHYILDEQQNPVPEPDSIAWRRWYQNANRTVGRATFSLGTQDIEVSTVFLSIPHISKEMDNNEVMLYETMVFADEAILQRLLELSERDDRSIIAWLFGGVDIQKRYATRTDAVQGHETMCTFIATCLSSGLLTIESAGEA